MLGYGLKWLHSDQEFMFLLLLNMIILLINAIHSVFRIRVDPSFIPKIHISIVHGN
ncbi:protein of unknown function [Candidatus Nitrosocosmicus franklandus]|uniref:Uncharacterized protein n=1 Tax=Candidatus Nitrosocosmicus franklandianus TaxID=1798806 RepID=A0A484I6U0_9ARCH|nr:protein of unknown function [Candidatus Nitrosocosmicus franklandus]